MTKSTRQLVFLLLGIAVVFGLLFFGRSLWLEHGRIVQCPDGPRLTIDLRDFETKYLGYSLSLEAKLENRGSLTGKLDQAAIGELSEVMQEGREFRKWLVGSYNSCIFSNAEYAAAGKRFQALDGLARQIDKLSGMPDLSDEDRSRLGRLTDTYVQEVQALGEERSGKKL